MKNLFKFTLMATFVFVVGGGLSAAEQKAVLAHMESASISLGFTVEHDALAGIEKLAANLHEVDFSLIDEYSKCQEPIIMERPSMNVKRVSAAMINKCAKESYHIVLMQKHRKYIERITGGH